MNNRLRSEGETSLFRLCMLLAIIFINVGTSGWPRLFCYNNHHHQALKQPFMARTMVMMCILH